VVSSNSTADRARNIANLNSPLHVAILTCLVAAISFIAARMAGTLVIRPQLIWPLWPGNVLVVFVFLLVRRKMWPIVITAAYAAFVVSDLLEGLPLRSSAILILSDTVEILIAAMCLSYSFEGVPQLNSLKSLARYFLFAVILAPLAGSIICAFAIPTNYWAALRISFFSEALGFLILMPAISGWLQRGRSWVQKFRNNYLEAPALLTALILFGYLAFETGRRGYRPVLLYLLIPFLLWSALRFGATGVSTSMIVIGFLSVRGAIHGVGPFTYTDPITNLMSLQSFLFLSAALFMVLAVLVEERKQAEEELLEAHRVARLGSWSWDPVTDAVSWSRELYRMAGYDPRHLPPTFKEHEQLFTPESWDRLRQEVEWTMQTGAPYELDLESIRRDGAKLWITSRGEVVRDAAGRVIRLRGTIQDITERKRAERGIQESEKRFRLVANTAPVLIWMSGPDKSCTFFNQGWLDFTGRPLEDELGDGWASGVHPEDLQHCLEVYSRAFDARLDFQMEYRLRRHDGQYRWITDVGVPRFGADDSFQGFIGSCIDITEQKVSEEALLDMSGRLITAHEEERARIARELHDDLSQRMALLEIGLEEFEQETRGLSPIARRRLHNIAEIATEISSDIHNLSHELHPAKLDSLGLVAAVGGFCREFSTQHGLHVQFAHHQMEGPIPKDVTLCLFRIVQEALRNVVKHSGATQARVELTCYGDRIDLCVSDSGRGFDPEPSKGIAGLGLISMRERLRLVGGHLAVESERLVGTRIQARVPLTTTAEQVLIK
jgi:PAS domain S-box-containing protein